MQRITRSCNSPMPEILFEQNQMLLLKIELKTLWRQGKSERLLLAGARNDIIIIQYKIMMKKLETNYPLLELDCQTMTNIVSTLFPDHGQRVDEDITASLLFTSEKLQKVARSLKSYKAPQPDGVPPEVMKLIAKEQFKSDLRRHPN